MRFTIYYITVKHMLYHGVGIRSFWPTVLRKVAPLSQHVVCRLSSSVVCDVLYCGLYDRRPQMFAPSRRFSGP